MPIPPPTELYWNLAPHIVRKRAPDPAIRRFHESLPGYAPTLVLDLDELAENLGIGRVLVKLETERFGLPAFKILGASWAIAQELARRFDVRELTLDGLRSAIGTGTLTFVAATDGNHGRAVAHMARLLNQQALIFVPEGTADARIDAIRSEGAAVFIVQGSYDDAVAASARLQDDTHIVISDTAWDGYDQVPADVIDGYSTIFTELDDQLERTPDVVFVQAGVGALASATIGATDRWDSKLVIVEPDGEACILASLNLGRMVTLPDPKPSIMAGLNCETPSPVAWPTVRSGVDLAIAIPDAAARAAMRVAAEAGLAVGETGAAGLAGLLSVAEDEDWRRTRKRLKLGNGGTVLLIATEGVTDPDAWAEVTGLQRSR